MPTAVAFTDVTIASSGTISTAANLGDGVLTMLLMPATFTGTAVTFQVAESADGTYRALTDSAGAAVSVTVAASKAVALNPTTFLGVRHIKVVSGSAEGGARTVTLVTRPG
jgi:hypothetical protein